MDAKKSVFQFQSVFVALVGTLAGFGSWFLVAKKSTLRRRGFQNPMILQVLWERYYGLALFTPSPGLVETPLKKGYILHLVLKPRFGDGYIRLSLNCGF